MCYFCLYLFLVWQWFFFLGKKIYITAPYVKQCCLVSHGHKKFLWSMWLNLCLSQFFFFSPMAFFDTLSPEAPHSPGPCSLKATSGVTGFPSCLLALEGENKPLGTGQEVTLEPSLDLVKQVPLNSRSWKGEMHQSPASALESWSGCDALLPVCSRSIFPWEVGSSVVSHSN